MRRRRVLATTAAVIGVGSYEWYVGRSTDGRNTTGTTTETAEKTSVTADRPRAAAPTPSIGGSLNGRPHRLNDSLGLVEKSNTEWMHAFLDVREKVDQDVSPKEDPDIEALRRLSRDTGTKLIVSLQWDFMGLFGKKQPKHVPPSESDRERALFEFATELLAAINRPVEIILLGNEPIWQTLNEDLLGSDAPLLRFTRRLKDHLVQNYSTGNPRFLVGSLNRLYDASVRNKFGPFYRKLFKMARNDDDIDGVDLHVHYDELREARTMLTVAREALPDGTITATEFSPIWRYKRNTDERITAFVGGDQFANRYGHPNNMTVLEYFKAAQENPRSREEMADFMETMPWYNVNFVEDMYDLLTEYGVEVGAVGFLQGTGFRHVELTPDWRPFQINYLFQRGLIDTHDGSHPHYLNDYRKRT